MINVKTSSQHLLLIATILYFVNPSYDGKENLEFCFPLHLGKWNTIFLENSVTSIGYNLFPLYFMFFMPNEINVLNKWQIKCVRQAVFFFWYQNSMFGLLFPRIFCISGWWSKLRYEIIWRFYLERWSQWYTLLGRIFAIQSKPARMAAEASEAVTPFI